jgi:hypothetical protein
MDSSEKKPESEGALCAGRAPAAAVIEDVKVSLHLFHTHVYVFGIF